MDIWISAILKNITEKPVMPPKLPNIRDLCEILDGIVKKYGLSYMDAAIHYCEDVGIEVESIANAIKSNDKLKSLIQVEAEDLNLLMKISRIEL